MKIDLPLNKLRAIAQFMATKDTRYYLNTVCVEVSNGVLRLVATDGSVCGVANLGECLEPDGQWSIKSETVAMLCKLKMESVPAEFTKEEVKLQTVTGDLTAKLLADAKFPDWRRATAMLPPGDYPVAQFDPELLMRVKKAAALATGMKSVAFGFEARGSRGYFSVPGADIAGVVMALIGNEKLTPRFNESLYKAVM